MAAVHVSLGVVGFSFLSIFLPVLLFHSLNDSVIHPLIFHSFTHSYIHSFLPSPIYLSITPLYVAYIS